MSLQGAAKPQPVSYEALGLIDRKTELRCVFRTDFGTTVEMTPGRLAAVSSLMQLYPDVEYWRVNFPHRWNSSRHHGIDLENASAALIRACRAKGVYVPPDSK